MKNRSNLREIIIDDITNDIISGKLKPGEKIPGEFELVDKYKVSRATVREALKMLESKGLITIKHGAGSFVNDVTPESFMKPLLPILVLSDFDVRDILEARLPLEVQAISLCVDKIEPEQINELKHLVNEMEVKLSDNEIEQYNDMDLDFHLLIAKASNNRVLYQMINALKDLLKEQMKRNIVIPNATERSIMRHRLMVEAIEHKEKELAMQLMTLHINDSIDALEITF